MNDRAIDPKYVTEVRTWALDRALTEIGPGTPWEKCFELADRYKTFILEGTWTTPVADAKKAEEEAQQAAAEAAARAAAEEHEFVHSSRQRTLCSVCGKLYGEGPHK